MFELDQNWNDFFLNSISELMLAKLIQRYDKKFISFQERETNWILQAVEWHILWLY